ncbi:hypothetical protein LP422_19865 [Janibacter limosus]|uniref:Uncharacterized protein n=1 Tax=Janibacter limosus TaxID=53458 RepID=A0AC61U3I5_9MICO|nr:hypothetical protein [Janibacter limosus]UUZ44590.1 hypothetical protein LP422_19865 [Janibacter limosus]
MSAQPTFVLYCRQAPQTPPAKGARIVAYGCTTDGIFRVVWPEVDAPLVHPCPECDAAALRLIGTRPDTA